jgi:hypothetical protein
MGTTLRGWEPIRVVREGRQIACSNGIFKAVTKDNVTTREGQDDDRDEEPTGRGKNIAGIEDGKTGSVGALAREGGAVDNGD